MRNANSLRNTWKGIKKLININKCKTSETSSLVVDDKLISGSMDVTNAYNNYFSSVAEKLKKNICKTKKFQSYLQTKNENIFFNFPTTKEEVINVIDHLDCSKSTGPQSIPTDVFKFIKLIVSESFSDIINLSFSTGLFIYNLKVSKIIPIYKEKESKAKLN